MIQASSVLSLYLKDIYSHYLLFRVDSHYTHATLYKDGQRFAQESSRVALEMNTI